ncbi:MAG: CsbD family protein [Chitinispirillaceae bacterium]|nr:CsbD family protein [Chitinispirillaceae bacterium]
MKKPVKSSTKNQTEGAVHQVSGTIKEAAGNLSDNPKLKAKGIVEKMAGKLQEKIGQVGKVLGK